MFGSSSKFKAKNPCADLIHILSALSFFFSWIFKDKSSNCKTFYALITIFDTDDVRQKTSQFKILPKDTSCINNFAQM